MDKQCIWQKLTTETIKRTKNGEGKGFYVKVPLKQELLNEISKTELLSFTNLPEHITNYNLLLSQKNLCKLSKMEVKSNFIQRNG